jgi:IclR family acetate operon transcriptional repressor
MPGEKRSDEVGVLVKALDILDCLAADGPSPVTRICERTGVTKPAAYRILKTLDMAGYVVRDDERREYSLGPALHSLSRSARNSTDLVRVARPVMERLNDELGETINLGVVSHGQVVYLDTIESTQRLRSTVQLSLRDKLHSTALGKAFLAALPEDDAKVRLSEAPRESMTPKTVVSIRALLRQLGEVRERGYALDDEENEVGSRCVAAAILNGRREPIGAISVSAPTTRMQGADLGRVGKRVAVAASEISSAIT